MIIVQIMWCLIQKNRTFRKVSDVASTSLHNNEITNVNSPIDTNACALGQDLPIGIKLS